MSYPRDLTMADLLLRWPQAATILLQHGMACVGCDLASFETLAEAADVYGLSLERLVGELAGEPAPGESRDENKEEKMSKVGETIRNHHREMLHELKDKVAAIADRSPAADPRGLAAFLKEDLLLHAVGEERHMYPAVEPLIKQYGNATATMSVDHEYIAGYIDEIHSAAQALQAAQGAERQALEERLARLALKLEALLEVHLEKEERIYVPLFEERVPEDEQQRVLDGMHEAYKERASEGVTQTVDVRQIPPPQRHTLIFETFEALKPGEAFLLVNDHDPRPLYYQFKYEREGEFTWDYIEQGPQVWQVRIGKAESARDTVQRMAKSS